MRALAAAACLVGVAIVMTGCGVDKDPGQIAVTTIEDDWEGFYVVTQRPVPVAARSRGLGHDPAHRLRSEDERRPARSPARSSSAAAPAERPAKTLHVLVRFDDQDVLREWKFTG